MNQNRLNLLASTPIPKALLTLGLPTMIGMLINAFYNLADAYFVAGLGREQLGAITAAYPLGQIIVGIGLMFGNGAASYLSRLLGSGRREDADQVASTALYISLAAGGAAILAMLVFLRPLLLVLHTSETILPYAMTYAGIYIAGSIFNVFNVTMNNIVSSEGAAQTTMFVLLTGALLNVVLDPILIYGLGLGVTGAALATVFSQFFSALIYLRYINSKKSNYSFSVKRITFTANIMSEIFKIGVPTLLFQLLTSLSIALINRQASGYGDSVFAAMGPVTRITSIGSLMVFGFLKGFQPIAGYSYGSRQFDRLREALRTAAVWSTAFCIAVGLAGALLAKILLSGFCGDDAEMLAAGTKALRAGCLSFLPFGFHTVYSFLFLAMGKAKEGLFLGCCRQGICFLPLIFLLPHFFGLNGVLYAQPAADLLAALVTIPLAIRLHRQLAVEEFLR